jgi:3'-phosphoadenosine 5'-phosphosulfate sulfotransferase (PAPS reductase)/FAD synthetase
MRDPFKIDGPTCISFSGGRTSAYMLWRVLQSNGGLPAGARVLFANTGKEDEATLRFVRECSRRWGVPIAWLEYRIDPPGFAVVDFDTASRAGEPFEALLRKRRFLPNSVTRFCTSELKIRVMFKHIRSLGLLDGEQGVEQMIGIRADEARRVAKMRNGKHPESTKIDNLVPLADAGVTVHDVAAFWTAQPFDLELPSVNGRTVHGNCDLCFLKPAAQVLSLINEKPSRAVWWAAMETHAKTFATRESGDGWRFRTDRASYAEMLANATDQADAFGHDPDEEAIACFCGD